MRRHLLTATALASFAVVTNSPYLEAQTALPGYAASVAGATSTTSTTAAAIISFGAGWNTTYQLHINAIQCGRTDAGGSAIRVTFNDLASTVMVIPGSTGGGQNAMLFASPLQVAANTNFTMSLSTNTTTVYCSAQGFVAN
jgi:hypothetical protein